MTVTATRPPATLPADHFEILKRYAANKSLDQISSETGADAEAVLNVVQSVAKFSRPRATQLVREHETWMRNTALRTAPAEPVAAAAADPEPPAAEPTAPVITVTRRPAPEPAEQLDPPVIGDVADLLGAAERTGVARLERLAGRIREQIQELQAGVAEHARRAELVAEEAQLRARLAEVQARLKGKPAADPVPNAAATPTAKEVRAWAASAGVECNPHGRVTQSVVDQYLAAHR